MPEFQFRQMNKDLIEKDLLEIRLEEIPTVEEKTSPALTFIAGFLLGSLTVLAVEKFGFPNGR